MVRMPGPRSGTANRTLSAFGWSITTQI